MDAEQKAAVAEELAEALAGGRTFGDGSGRVGFQMPNGQWVVFPAEIYREALAHDLKDIFARDRK